MTQQVPKLLNVTFWSKTLTVLPARSAAWSGHPPHTPLVTLCWARRKKVLQRRADCGPWGPRALQGEPARSTALCSSRCYPTAALGSLLTHWNVETRPQNSRVAKSLQRPSWRAKSYSVKKERMGHLALGDVRTVAARQVTCHFTQNTRALGKADTMTGVRHTSRTELTSVTRTPSLTGGQHPQRPVPNVRLLQELEEFTAVGVHQ